VFGKELSQFLRFNPIGSRWKDFHGIKSKLGGTAATVAQTFAENKRASFRFGH